MGRQPMSGSECNLVRKHIVVRGRVHAVGYRAWCLRIGRSMRLRGWVRNLDDGRVEVVLEGERDAVERAVPMITGGPPLAAVRDFAVTEEAVSGEEAFHVR